MSLNTTDDKQFSFFRRFPQGDVRMFADLLEIINPYRFRIMTKSGERIIESHYDMTKMMIGKRIMAGYLYKGPGDPAPMMHPLPPDATDKSEPVDKYEKVNRKTYLFEDKVIAAKNTNLAEIENQIQDALQLRQELTHSQIQFAKLFKPLAKDATTSPSTETSQTTTNPSNMTPLNTTQSSSQPIPVQSTVSTPLKVQAIESNTKGKEDTEEDSKSKRSFFHRNKKEIPIEDKPDSKGKKKTIKRIRKDYFSD